MLRSDERRCKQSDGATGETKGDTEGGATGDMEDGGTGDTGGPGATRA